MNKNIPKNPILSAVLGSADLFPLQSRIFHGVLLITVALCLGTAIVNIAVRLPAPAIAASAFSVALFTIAYIVSRFYRITNLTMWITALWLPVFAGFVWICNGGSAGATHGFLIILPLFFLAFASVRQRFVLAVAYCGISVGLLTIEYAYPWLIQEYTDRFARYLDVLFATVGTQAAVVIIVGLFIREHAKVTTELNRLRERSENRFGEVADTIPAMIMELNSDLSIDFANRASQSLTGYSATQIGQRVGLSRLIHPDDWQQVKLRLAGVMAGKDALSEECRLLAQDGSCKTVLMRAVARHHDGNGPPNGILLYMVDITEKKLLEQQYLKAQKMESIGMLAGGIAHDFNNILTGIMGYANLIKLKHADSGDKELLDNVEPIITASKRASDLVRRLLVFSRQQPFQIASVDLCGLVHEVKDLLSRTIDKRITVVADTPSEPLVVQGDRSVLHSAIMNLCVNARDAMPHGGTLTLSCKRVATVDPDVDAMPTLFPAAGFVCIIVADTGIGMSPDVRKHLFEPFFTTKGAGKGTGLGLASVHGAVTGHGGRISVNSEPGKGTAFKIFLPLSNVMVIESETAQERAPAFTRAERVLVVDDEALVGGFVKEVLTKAGHEAVLLNNPSQAVALFHAAEKPFTFAIIDMIMPGMSGLDLIKSLHEINDDLRVLLISGFAGSGDTQTIPRDFRIRQLAKPFAPETLLRAMEQMIAAREHSLRHA